MVSSYPLMEGVMVRDAPVPLTVMLPPLGAALPTNVPLLAADQIPSSV
jgi:hypothetical protein